MSIRTLLLYLIGQRQAILEVASNRQSLGIGALLVLSAALAREYDGADLWRAPWHLIVPVAASSGAAFLLYVVVLIADWKKTCRPLTRGNPLFLSILGLFWMTAPLAWLYAIPVERVLDPVGATQMNLAFLAIVSLWRVALMIRAIQVVLGWRFMQATSIVLLFASGLAAALSHVTQFAIIGPMGGFRNVSDSELLIADVAGGVACISTLLVPLSWLAVYWLCIRGQRTDSPPPALVVEGRHSTLGLWLLAVASIASWFIVLPHTQCEQQLRISVEDQLAAGKIAEALQIMSAHEQDEFPPHWDPLRPTRDLFHGELPMLLKIMKVIAKESPAPWVRVLFLDRFEKNLAKLYQLRTRGEEIPEIVALFDALPEGAALEKSLRNALQQPDDGWHKEWKDELLRMLNHQRKGPELEIPSRE